MLFGYLREKKSFSEPYLTFLCQTTFSWHSTIRIHWISLTFCNLYHIKITILNLFTFSAKVHWMVIFIIWYKPQKTGEIQWIPMLECQENVIWTWKYQIRIIKTFFLTKIPKTGQKAHLNHTCRCKKWKIWHFWEIP